MSIESLLVGVTGGTPGADSNDYKLFDSTVTFASGGGTSSGLRTHCISRVIFGVQNDQSGTLKAYWSANRGTTWNQYDSQSVSIPAANTSSGPYAYLVDPYDDFKLVWTNGGSAQTTWRTSLTLVRNDRSSGT